MGEFQKIQGDLKQTWLWRFILGMSINKQNIDLLYWKKFMLSLVKASILATEQISC